VSAVLFSAVHYVGSFGDPLALGTFVFRVLAGLFFTALYRWRGFAVAVWCHAIYDVIFFLLLT
jgi:membrane protease YdiL (CAAX protease family)